jgi:glycosyltransferase involved in cell wall biosynthesis
VHTLIGKADIVVVPSLWEEAFGLIVAESMASGTPVIASRIGGIPELIENDVSGHLFEPGNAEELAFKIVKLLSDKQKQAAMSEAAQEKVVRQFDIFDQIKAIVEIYESA